MASERHRRDCGSDDLISMIKLYNGNDRSAFNRSILIDQIHGFYKAALGRLPLEEMPMLASRLLKAGLCIGFMDPVSNIIANTLSYRPPPTDREEKTASGGARKRKRKKRRVKRSAEALAKMALSRIVTDISNVSLRNPSIAVRSMKSLITFLVCKFRYLLSSAAMDLIIANADLLTAVQLIQQDRKSDAFSVASPTAKVALSCAAVAGCHPKPDALVIDWQSMYHHQRLVSNAMSVERMISSTNIRDIYKLLKELPQEPTNRVDPLRVTASKIFFDVVTPVPRLISARCLRSILLDRIHGFFVEALGRLPRDSWRRRLHRSLLKAGHCYGPMDPVSNIILNTIWYDTVFPQEEEFEMDTILSESLTRIASRSLYGLLAFIRTHFDSISDTDAVWYLFLANANLDQALNIAQHEGRTVVINHHQAYKAAAKAGWHPSPDAHVAFVVSTLTKMSPEQSSLLQAEGPLSLGDVDSLSRFFSSECSDSGSLKPVPALSKKASRMLSRMKKELQYGENSVCRKVEAALGKYAQLNKESEYELHAICAVNDNVVETANFQDPPGWLRKSPVVYQYCHVNFLASRKCLDSAGEVPILFFAELSNDEDNNEELSCWPVVALSTDAGRCFYCENYGAKVVHPAFDHYHGRDEDFKEMVNEEHLSGWSNDAIVNNGANACHFLGILEEDCIYFDRCRDVKYAKHINSRAKYGRPTCCSLREL